MTMDQTETDALTRRIQNISVVAAKEAPLRAVIQNQSNNGNCEKPANR